MKPKHPAGPPMTLGTWVHENSALCLALLVASGTTTAQQKFDLSDANVTRAVNELSGEMLECAVFFAIGAQCVRRHPDQSVPGVVTDVMTAFQDMLDLAARLAGQQAYRMLRLRAGGTWPPMRC